MKTAISYPDALGLRFDAVARAHGMNRSEFFQRAGERYADELEASSATDEINAAVDACASTADESPARSAARKLAETGAWTW